MTLRIAALCIAGCLWGPAEAFESCPAQLDATIVSSSIPEGWQYSSEKKAALRLSGATFSDGHPRELALLKPFNTEFSGVNSKRTTTYRFGASYPGGVWLICRYGSVTTLFRRLAKNPKQCQIVQVEDSMGVQSQTITCR